MNNKIAIFLHLYYCDLWDEFQSVFSTIPIPFSLYVNLVEDNPLNEQTEQAILKAYPSAIVITSPNQGLDVGGRLRLMDRWIKEDGQEEIIIFLHSKKSLHSVGEEVGTSWRKILLSIIDGDNLPTALKLFDNPSVGMVGKKAFLHKEIGSGSGRTTIQEYSNMLGIDFPINSYYIAGTMFLVRSSIYKEAFTKVPPLDIANGLEKGYFLDTASSKTHGLERILGAIVISRGYRVEGV